MSENFSEKNTVDIASLRVNRSSRSKRRGRKPRNVTQYNDLCNWLRIAILIPDRGLFLKEFQKRELFYLHCYYINIGVVVWVYVSLFSFSLLIFSNSSISMYRILTYHIGFLPLTHSLPTTKAPQPYLRQHCEEQRQRQKPRKEWWQRQWISSLFSFFKE